MNAMGCDRFVVTLIDTKLGKQEERQWNKEKIIKSIGWLKRMNARGYDVWIRPAGDHGLVVLGGLTDVHLRKLRERGFAPAVAVETGTGQHQAWIKLSKLPVLDKLRAQVAAGLLKDIALVGTHATGRNDGRLAGFTNQQVNRSGGKHPFVVVATSDGLTALAAQAHLEDLAKANSRAAPLQEAQRGRSRGLGR